MPASNQNVERFNRICLRLFADLYESFPVPIGIDPNQLGFAIGDRADYDDTWSSMEIARETINFLHQEGFLTVDARVMSGEFGGVRLTMKGLAVLGIPVSLTTDVPREPIIEKIKRVMGKGAEKAATETIQAVVSEVFKFALSSATVVSSAIAT